MSLFKKFTDFCAGVAAFVGGLHIIQKYMAFKPKTDAEYIQWISKNPDYSKEYVSTVTEAPGKFSQFTTPALNKNIDYRPLILLVILFLVAILLGRILSKYPHGAFAVSLVPAIFVAYLVFQGTLLTQPGIFITFSFLFVLGNLVECILRDREDGGHRLWIASRISMATSAFSCLAFAVAPMVIPTEGMRTHTSILPELIFGVSSVKILPADPIKKDLIAFPELLFGVTDSVTEMLVVVGIMFAALLLITTLLYNVYFADAILSAVPLVYMIYMLYGEPLNAFTAMLLASSVICFASCLLLCIFENNFSKEERFPTYKRAAVQELTQESTQEPAQEPEIEVEQTPEPKSKSKDKQKDKQKNVKKNLKNPTSKKSNSKSKNKKKSKR